MTEQEIDREEPINLDASSSQELKRVLLVSQADENLSASHIIPDARPHKMRSHTSLRELLRQPFDDVRV